MVVGVVDFAPLFGEEEGRACFLALPEGDVQRSQLVSCSIIISKSTFKM